LKKALLSLLCAVLLGKAGELTLKYAINDEELAEKAEKAGEILREDSVYLGVIVKSEMFAGESGLAALKMGYIDLYAANASDLQYAINSIWTKLEKAKKSDFEEIKKSLRYLGFELIAIRFFKKKTVMILANKQSFDSLNAAIQQILLESL
jgi:TRAP-type C4-dicarboxylate transport system substrate-binding protein